MKSDKSARPVYQHYIYTKEGIFIFLKYDFTAEPDPEYLELLEIQSNTRKEYSEYIRSLPKGEREEAYNNIPETNYWRNGINGILPILPHDNDGKFRRGRLKGRLNREFTLFPEVAEDLYKKEISERSDYFTGNSIYDEMKKESCEMFTAEYWHSYFLAEGKYKTCVIVKGCCKGEVA